MYAVIIQSAPSAGATRQTIVLPSADGVRVFNRFAGKRGIAGAYAEGMPVTVTNELVRGVPVALSITPTDLEHIETNENHQPHQLFQRLVREVAKVDQSVSNESLEAVLGKVIDLADQRPTDLAGFLRAPGTPVAVQVVRQAPVAPAPSVAPVVTHSPEVTSVASGSGVEIHPELSIPNLDSLSWYVPRHREVNRFDMCRRLKKNLIIFGHAGTGKTSSAKHYAGLRNLPFVVIECNPQTDEEIVQGGWIPTGDGKTLAWRWSPLAEAIQNPDGAVILINEANRMSAKANALFLRILEERKLLVSRYDNRDIEVNDNVLFILDANPGYKGTTAMDEALLDRAVKTEYRYDREVESKFIPSSTLLDIAFDVRAMLERGEIRVPFSSRMLKDFVDVAQDIDGGITEAVDMLLENFPKGVDRDAVRMSIELQLSAIANELGVTA
jgi:MoxR-like ATPase